MYVNKKVSKEGEWFDYRDSVVDSDTGEIIWKEPTGESMRIRSTKPFYEDAFLKRERIVEWKIHPKSKQNERHSYTKDHSPEEMLELKNDSYDYAITGLKGWMDWETKKELKCTRENKLFLMSIPVVERFFSDCQSLLDNYGLMIEEQAAKNLSSGSSSQTSKPDSE